MAAILSLPQCVKQTRERWSDHSCQEPVGFFVIAGFVSCQLYLNHMEVIAFKNIARNLTCSARRDSSAPVLVA